MLLKCNTFSAVPCNQQSAFTGNELAHPHINLYLRQLSATEIATQWRRSRQLNKSRLKLTYVGTGDVTAEHEAVEGERSEERRVYGDAERRDLDLILDLSTATCCYVVV